MIKTNFFKQKLSRNAVQRFFALAAIVSLSAQKALAGGADGINAGTSELAQYLDPVANLVLAVGAIVGLVGGIRVYIKWNSGDQDVNKEIMGWMGSCVFLVLVSVIIKAFFT